MIYTRGKRYFTSKIRETVGWEDSEIRLRWSFYNLESSLKNH